MSWIKRYIDKCQEKGINPFESAVNHEIAMEVEIERIDYEKRLANRARIRRILCGYYRLQKFFNKFSLSK